MQQILTERHSGKTKQKTNWSISTFKGKHKFFRFEIVKFKTRAFNRKIEIKPIPILLNISLTAPNNLILLSVFRVGFDAQFHQLCYKTIGSCFQLCTIELCSTWEVRRALKKLELLSKLPACSITRQCTAKSTNQLFYNIHVAGGILHKILRE